LYKKNNYSLLLLTKAVFNSILPEASHSYFKNAVGHLLAHPLGHYIAVEYYPGPRQPADLQAFLTHAGQLLARWGWDKLIGQQGQMAPLTPAEVEWLTAYWRSHAQQRSIATVLYGALLLPHEAFAGFSWRANRSVPASPFRQAATVAQVA
jgi:hypothetical protein